MRVAEIREKLPHFLSLEPRPGNLGSSAAVLLGMAELDGATRLWLIRRPDHMRSHAGQVAFPGGKFDASDGDLVETALRESEEEVGLKREHVHILGSLPEVTTGTTGYQVTPFVAIINPAFVPEPNPREVARAFTLPLHDVRQGMRDVHPFTGVTLEGERLWGLSAWMVKLLDEVLTKASTP